MGANSISFLLTTGMTALAFMARVSHLIKSHERLGLTIYIMVALQAFSAFFHPSPNPVKEDSDDDTPEDPNPASSLESGEEAEGNDEIAPLENEGFYEKRCVENAALDVWSSCGDTFMYTIYAGIGEYELKFGEEQSRKTVYWVWFGLITTIVLTRMWVRR